ncbi:MAG: transcription initiation protein, partial [Planctomycetes bacterium]|nr:transcription initiation protein [Planctomycetota bacterium]
MTRFMLVLRGDVTKDYSHLTPDDMQRILGAYEAWAGRMAGEGRLKAGHKLMDEGGRVIRPAGKSSAVSDGPYAETKEVVGGYYLLDADDYDHAVRLCEGHPNLEFGSIEI